MIKITDLMADLYEGNSDAQKTALWGGPHDWHILCLTKAFLSILEVFRFKAFFILFYSVLFCFILFYSVLFC
jgi:hypothetical protein